MPQWERTDNSGRSIYLVTGRISQTVNVCTTENERGKYDWIVRLPPQHSVTSSEVMAQPDVRSLIRWLERERKGQIEQMPQGEEAEASLPTGEVDLTPSLIEPTDVLWIERAKQITEICIDELVREFLDLPFLHRVEHSIHTRLYSILRTQPHFDRLFPLAEQGMLTQLIHKEWPETIPRPEKGNRRGNFDLAILTPDTLKTCALRDFSAGRVAPPIAIEMGLNYSEGHLSLDAEKLLNSQVRHGYLVHLLREMPYDSTIDQTIDRLRGEPTVKVAFARYDRGKKFSKLLNDPAIYEVK